MTTDSAERPIDVLLTQKELESAGILNLFAFCQDQYLPEKLAGYRRQLSDKGFGDDHIREWRLWFLPTDTADTFCEKCQEEITFELEELLDGRFTCPLCKANLPVRYAELSPRQIYDPLQTLTDRLENDVSDQTAVVLPEETSSEKLMQLLARGDVRLLSEPSERIRCRLMLRGVPFSAFQEMFDKAEQDRLPVLTSSGELPIEEAVAENSDADIEESGLPSISVENHVPFRPAEAPAPAPTQERGLKYSSLSDQEILETLANRVDQLTDQDSDELYRLLSGRGYVSDDVEAYRAGRLLSRHLYGYKPKEVSIAQEKAVVSHHWNWVLVLLLLVASLLLAAPSGSWVSRVSEPFMRVFEEYRDTWTLTRILLLGAVVMAFDAIRYAFWLDRNYQKVAPADSERIKPPALVFAMAVPVWSSVLQYRAARDLFKGTYSSGDASTADLALQYSRGQRFPAVTVIFGSPAILLYWAVWDAYWGLQLWDAAPGLDLTYWWNSLYLQIISVLLAMYFTRKIFKEQKRQLQQPGIRAY